MADWSLAVTRRFAVCAIVPLLLPQASHAQQFPETERQKAEALREKAQDARKKADREATDEAYKAMTAQRRGPAKRSTRGEVCEQRPASKPITANEIDAPTINWSDEETDEPLLADHRNFYKVEKVNQGRPGRAHAPPCPLPRQGHL